MYLDGVKGGLMAYDAWLNRHGGQPAFCMPAHLAMTTEQTEDIMLNQPPSVRRKAICWSLFCCSVA